MNSIIKGALFFIEDYCNDNKISFNEDFYYKRLIDWYSNSDIADEVLLAAVAIECDYDNSIGINNIYEYGEKYFGEYVRQLRWENEDNDMRTGGMENEDF